MIVSVTLPQPNAGERSAYRRVDCARPCRAVFPVIGPCPSLFWANSFPVITISSKMLFVAVNAPQLASPTGIFETVGGGFPVFFPVPCPDRLCDPGPSGRQRHDILATLVSDQGGAARAR